MRTLVWIFALFGIVVPYGLAQQKEFSGGMLSVSEALSSKPRSNAYSRFIKLFLLEPPQLSDADRDRVDRARSGDSDAFAIVSFMIWQGDLGFRMDKDAAVLGLLKALEDGSGAGAFFRGEIFLQVQARDDIERANNYRRALPWYGKAHAMGVRLASRRAAELMTFIGATLLVPESDLMSEYAQGQSAGNTRLIKPEEK